MLLVNGLHQSWCYSRFPREFVNGIMHTFFTPTLALKNCVLHAWLRPQNSGQFLLKATES